MIYYNFPISEKGKCKKRCVLFHATYKRIQFSVMQFFNSSVLLFLI